MPNATGALGDPRDVAGDDVAAFDRAGAIRQIDGYRIGDGPDGPRSALAQKYVDQSGKPTAAMRPKLGHPVRILN